MSVVMMFSIVWFSNQSLSVGMKLRMSKVLLTLMSVRYFDGNPMFLGLRP